MAGLNTYSTEPITSGKVILHTSLGPLDIELWPKEAPKACRNFVQLCLERYYDGHAFHRVIKGFMAQTGYPTGTGKGGESVFGHPFEDEFHGRLRFTHRGLLAMANSAPNSNGSQFFITLDRCDWLDRRHTIFGKVTGNSIYNINRLNDLDVGEGDLPLHPPTIVSTEVLFDPFPDIAPRQVVHVPPQLAAAQQAQQREQAQREAKRPRRTKDRALLSFGNQEDAQEPQPEPEAQQDGTDKAADASGAAARPKSKSVHDVLLHDQRLSRTPAVLLPAQPAPGAVRAAQGAVADEGAQAQAEAEGEADARSFSVRMREQQQQRQAKQQAGIEAAARAAGSSSAAPPPQSEYERLKHALVASAAAAALPPPAPPSSAPPAPATGLGWKWRGRRQGEAGASGSDEGSGSDDDAPGDSQQEGGARPAAACSAGDVLGLQSRRARFVSKARQLKQLDKKERARETALKLRMFEQGVHKSSLFAHKLGKPAPAIAEGNDDQYVTADPLADDENAEKSRAILKIQERQRLFKRTNEVQPGDPD